MQMNSKRGIFWLIKKIITFNDPEICHLSVQLLSMYVMQCCQFILCIMMVVRTLKGKETKLQAILRKFPDESDKDTSSWQNLKGLPMQQIHQTLIPSSH